MSKLRIVVALLALAAIGVGLWNLHAATDGLTVTRTHVGTIPVTVFRAASGTPGPGVVIAHGFSGSQQLMLPFAVTLARNGYTALTFDFPGHGQNGTPMAGGLTDQERSATVLLGALDQVVAYARTLPGVDGHLAVLGHSMASDLVVRYARAHPQVDATVAVSLFGPPVTPDSPRNLLVIVGALEPAMLRDEAKRIAAMATADGTAEPRVTYGSIAAGTARRFSLSGGVEHIGVLFSRQSMTEALGWLDLSFGRTGAPGFIDHRGPWIGILYAGLVALAWPLARLLPVAARVRIGGGLRWRRLLLAAVLPALLTPLVLMKVPTDFLPLLLGDYLVVHFAVYGVLTMLGWWLAGGRPHSPPAVSVRGLPLRGVSSRAISWGAVLVGLVAMTAYGVFAIGLPLDAYVSNFLPGPGRWKFILAMLCGTLPYFVADEWLTRGEVAGRGAYALTKFFFLVSLGIAVALNLQRLFFLIIIIPVVLILFVIYGLFSTWAYRRTNVPLVGAVANAVCFAWAIAVTFPVVAP